MDRFLKSRGLWPAAVAVQRQELLLSDPLEKNAALVNEFKPDLLQTGGSYLTLMCVNIWRTDEGFHRPKIVVYGADSISDSARRLIEEDLKIPVFSFYGAAEASGIGFDCEQHLGLHLNIDLCPIRIVDGNGSTLPEGDVGDVVVSNLVNRGTVLLNYRLGDIAALLPDQCPCGRSLPLLSYPPGRVDDLIPLPSGRVLHPVLLRSILLDEEVWEFQVVQKTKTCFVISVVPNQECDKEQTKRHIMEKFARAFGEDIVVEVSFVDSIGRTKMGKFRTILSIAQRSTLGLTGDTEKD
jgi:phenylacetate-CoA ligase